MSVRDNSNDYNFTFLIPCDFSFYCIWVKNKIGFKVLLLQVKNICVHINVQIFRLICFFIFMDLIFESLVCAEYH